MATTISVPRSSVPTENVFYLRQAFKLALSLVLFYWLALSTNWDVPIYGALAIILVSLDTTGATIEKGVMRFVGTTVGVLIGFLILALCSHDRWVLMVAFSIYLAVIGYFMQASRYDYAWFVAAFVPLVVWADNYPHFESAFYFGIYRYLETTVGILIYTVVDIVLWPRQAGSHMADHGMQFYSTVQSFFKSVRQQLAGKSPSVDDSDLRGKLTASLKQLTSTLQNAYIDSPAVKDRKPLWEAWCLHASDLVDALLGWQDAEDSRLASEGVDHAPRFTKQTGILEQRLVRISTLWQQQQIADLTSAGEDARLLEPLEFDEDTADLDARSPEKSIEASCIGQLKSFDEASRELLRIQRVLAGLDRHHVSTLSPAREYLSRFFGWERKRVIQALFPPLAFIVAFLFWIVANPPAGPKVVFFAGNLGLVLLRTPMNLPAVLLVVLLIIFLIVAPIYWLVMPALSTSAELLSLIFIYSLCFGFLGGRSPALKVGTLVMFFSMTGISNRQVYSFNAMVDGGMMILLAGVIASVIYLFFKPSG